MTLSDGMNWPEATTGMKPGSPHRIRAANQIQRIFSGGWPRPGPCYRPMMGKTAAKTACLSFFGTV
jgi:hypothetical protein